MLTGCLLRPRDARRLPDVRGLQTNQRRTAVPIGATSEPWDTRQYQNKPGGGPDGGGDEYAIGGAANPEDDQSAHRHRLTPTDAAA
jgi:hypothetical protein